MAIVREIDLGLDGSSADIVHVEHPVCHHRAKVLDVMVRRVYGYEHERVDYRVMAVVMDIGVPEATFLASGAGPKYPGCIMRTLVCVRRKHGPQTPIPRDVGAYVGTVVHNGGSTSGPACWYVFESEDARSDVQRQRGEEAREQAAQAPSAQT